jgi:outer membrane protein OmpA-like peptidoglycan-associated protein/tetratricopeptide (TPR) repeat protein
MLNAQDKKTERAKENIKSYSYAVAIEKYEQLVKEGYSSEEIFKNLGDAYYQKADYIAAAHWYEQLFESFDTTIDSEYLYKYAQTLKSNGDYTASDVWMQKYSEANSADIRAIKYSLNKNYLEKIKANSSRYDISNLPINSTSADFAPSFFGQQLIFSTARDTGKILRNIDKWNNKPFTNLYSAKADENGTFSSAEKLSKKLNKKTHESSTVFSKDGTTVYFTRNNSKNGQFSRDKDGLSRLKIYRAYLRDNKWENIIELPFNSDNYSVAHPTLSADEKKLYFASDMPGTYGQSDIFVVDINEDGSFGIPKNLGNQINTESRETFPFVTSENVLYFASDGHPGLGGLDIFASKIDDLTAPYIVNVGEPINSLQDDFSFIIDEESRKGFFASSREGSIGSDDIYSFTENKKIVLRCNPIIDGWVKNKETGEPLVGAAVTLFNSKNEVIANTVSENAGVFSLKSSCNDDDFTLKISKAEYENDVNKFTVLNSKDVTGIEITLSKIIKKPSVGTDLLTYLNLAPIHFDLDKSEIRPDAISTLTSVIEFINKYPDINIEVKSHTDASASENYNIKLSERRAKATIAYLIAHGIKEGKVKGHGFGETQLLNDCTSKNKCDDAKHQINRRSEFIVIE